MIIADTSIWVQHFRRGLPNFKKILFDGRICMHPVVLGELAVSNLASRARVLAALKILPRTKIATQEECLDFIENHSLYGHGVGWNDVQLIVAARISGNRLWSLDHRLSKAAVGLGVAFQEP